jgi:hypothetical protein
MQNEECRMQNEMVITIEKERFSGGVKDDTGGRDHWLTL